MKEVWKPIKGYEGFYEISNTGNVASLNYNNTDKRKILIPKKNNKGYLWVELKHGKRRCCLIHRLVAEAFLKNENNYPIVNHKDENRTNNNVSNLEWCTYSYNVLFSNNLHRAERKKTFSNAKIGKKRTVKYDTRKIIQSDKKGNDIAVWNGFVEIRNSLNINEFGIRECCRGNRKTAYGYLWRFA